MTTTQVSLGASIPHVSTVPQPGAAQLLLSTSSGGAVTLTANLGDNVSSIVSVENFRNIALWIAANPGAATAVGQIVVLLSAERDIPLLGDDSWFAPAVPDTTPTDANLSGTVPTGADYTITPQWGTIKVRPLVIQTLAGSAGTDQIRMVQPVDVSYARWMYVAAKQTTAAMTMLIKWSACLG